MKVVCYGDSNTYGYDPRGPFGGHYEMPWPELLGMKTGWPVTNQGENGREIPGKSVSFPEDTQLLILMLGTNDLLQSRSPAEICRKMECFLSGISVPVLLVSPPPMVLGTWVPGRDLIDAAAILADGYSALSRKLGIPFVDAGQWHIPMAYDGVHMTGEGHRIFAERLHEYLNGAE